MSQIVLDAIAAELALLKREVPVQVGPFGYGVDTEGVLDISATCEDIDPFSPLAVTQALMRRLQTPRGTLPDDLNYGLDVRGFMNRGLDVDELRDVASAVRAECEKDDRVADAPVTATLAGKVLSLELEVTPVDPRRDSPFAFTLAVTKGELMLEALRVGA